MLSLPAGTEMFHFPALPPAALCIQATATVHDDGRVSPFGNPRINARLPAPRGLSQAPTSFIGAWCQDIHRMLLETWLNYTQTEPCDKVRNRCSRSLCSSQDTDGTTRTQPPSGDLSARPCENSNSAFTRRGYLARSGKIRAFIKETPAKAAASSGPNSVLIQLPARGARSAAPPERAAYWPRLRAASWMNSQCSTRKHGRPVTHSVTTGAGAP